jgi:hypothetical protein
MKKKKESLLSELEKLEGDEVIELVDVVEEPESKVSIRDLMAPDKEDLLGDIAPLETWEKPLKKEARREEAKEQPIRKEERPLETWERPFTKKQKPPEDELTLSFDDTVGEKVEETDLQLGKEALGEALFEKVDLQDILAKVEEINPSFAGEAAGAKGTAESQELPSTKKESSERFFNLEEFETALRKGVKMETVEEPPPSLLGEPPKTGVPSEVVPHAVPMAEGTAKPAARAEALESFFADEPVAEARAEMPPLEARRVEKVAAPAILAEDLQSLFKEESLEEVPTGLASSEAPLESETLTELSEEEFPEALLEEELKEEEVSIIEMPKEEKMGVIEEVQTPRVVPQEESVPVVARPDKQSEELITKGIQVMLEDFVKKVVPEIAQNMVNLTMERIEQLVKEIVPDLAQKAIQEEIKRLQTGEKD